MSELERLIAKANHLESEFATTKKKLDRLRNVAAEMANVLRASRRLNLWHLRGHQWFIDRDMALAAYENEGPAQGEAQ